MTDQSDSRTFTIRRGLTFSTASSRLTSTSNNNSTAIAQSKSEIKNRDINVHKHTSTFKQQSRYIPNVYNVIFDSNRVVVAPLEIRGRMRRTRSFTKRDLPDIYMRVCPFMYEYFRQPVDLHLLYWVVRKRCFVNVFVYVCVWVYRCINSYIYVDVLSRFWWGRTVLSFSK